MTAPGPAAPTAPHGTAITAPDGTAPTVPNGAAPTGPGRTPPTAPHGTPPTGPEGTAPTVPGGAAAAAAGRGASLLSAGEETEFRLLGPVEIRDGGAGSDIVPPGPKQRVLLSALVLHAGRPLSVDQLTEELWGERPPSNAANALQAHVARLRRLLPEQAGPVPGHEWISTGPAGYLLSLGRATTDVQRFARLSAKGRAALATDPGHAAQLLRRALALWRGPALQDSRCGPLCTGEADRLEENRLTALESLYDACLRCAQHGEITGELEKLTADHPLRERFYDLLMVALYRSGRQAEALGVYERARRRLVQGLGIEPGPVLRGRLQAILTHAPDLSAPAGPNRCAAPAGTVELGSEIARLQRHIDELCRRQEALVRRFDALAARLPETA
ncbi:AfsR/SARP family transcriptional regulator [Streptomyces sp. NPDC050211]|uniref:AfsR/SARP family transcriptional regulator n=1 Tax=Streptomyces sp. NPDC050211 TaxID=3154932 RepID=UPI003441EB81